jgi:hypothetical protein
MNPTVHSTPLLLPHDLTNQHHIKNEQFDEQSCENTQFTNDCKSGGLYTPPQVSLDSLYTLYTLVGVQ